MLYTTINFLVLAGKFVEKSVNATKDMLKDEDLMANNKPEVLEFKKNLTMFLDSIKENDDMEKAFDIMDIFINTTNHYLDLPKESETSETQFILDILNKYNIKDIKKGFLKDIDTFLEQFKVLFEAAKKELDKPMLEWFEKFSVIEDAEEKIDSFVKFMEFFDDKDE